MKFIKVFLSISLLSAVLIQSAQADQISHYQSAGKYSKHKKLSSKVQLGPRPFLLVKDMDAGKLKQKLSSCSKGPFKTSEFSIGHRGAPMKFPEHTKESYVAAAKMGAGIIECDVTFTKDRELVCRHSQCDLHTTTNILATPLAAKCSKPFTSAVYDSYGKLSKPASAQCCTSDITLEEFKSLKGKVDAANNRATNLDDYLNATASWRTDIYSSDGTLMTHRESIELFKKLKVKMTPELKSPSVPMPFEGDYSQLDYASQMLEEYIEADVDAKAVFAQSFNIEDIKYWINHYSDFGQQAVYLDGRYDDAVFDHTNPTTWSPSMAELVADGVQIIAPPMWMLVAVNDEGDIVPSLYAKQAKLAGLDIITWTIERSGLLKSGGGWYYQTMKPVINNDGDMYILLDVLAKDVGVLGVFADWPATVTYYANCMNLK